MLVHRIVGLYISLVFVIGRLVRTWSSGQSYRIIYEDLPTVDKLLRLCMDIFLVRENREYRLEEDLYSRLVCSFYSLDNRNYFHSEIGFDVMDCSF